MSALDGAIDLNTALATGNGLLSTWLLFILKDLQRRLTHLERGHMQFDEPYNGRERRSKERKERQ